MGATETPPSRGPPLPLIQPQLIKGVPALRAGLARGIPAIHLDQDSAVPLAFVSELPAHLAERDVVDRTGVSPARQRLDVQVFDTNHIELTHQTGRELMQGVLALLFHLGMNPRHPQPLLLAPPAAFLPPCQTPLLLTQVSEVCVITFGIRDLLPGRERGQVSESQVYTHRALYDRQPRRLDLHGETHVVAPHGIAREGHHVRSLHLGERFGELERAQLRQTHHPARPAPSHVLKPQARGYTLAFEARIASTMGEEITKGCILISQTLRETGCRHLRKPLMPRGALPLRQPPREVLPREPQSAFAVAFRADLERGVPEPSGRSKPPIEPPALSAIRIGTNAVTSRDRPHTGMLTPTRRRPQGRIQTCVAGRPARNASNRAARNGP